MKKELLKYLDRIGKLNYLGTMLRWEMDTIAPETSYDYLIDTSVSIQMESFKLTKSKEYIDLLNNLINSKEFIDLNDSEKIYILKCKNDYEKIINVPDEFYENYSRLQSESLNAWVKAKNENNYSIYKPYLIKIINETKKLYKYMFPNTNDLYESMVSTYEDGISLSLIDKLFNGLKNEIIPIINNLKNNNIDKSIINKEYTNDELYSISKFLLDYIGFDNNRGALGIYTHGYTTKLNDNDVRIVFNNKSDIIDHISTIIHEGGHGIFEQNISEVLKEYKTYDIDKVALHESQSRFYENILGRNINFYIPIYEELKKLLKIDLSIEEFIKLFNDAKKSLIRIKADELTYCLHIIIRYEIERDIFNNNIDLEDLDKIWNQKYKEYLGIDVLKDSDGILQDMHWSDGSFGYFPTYLLGSIFDGMLLEHINNKLGNVDELLKNNKIKEITKYLNENIHIYGGAYNINEVSNRLFNKDLEIEGIVNYFKSKYN